LNRHSTAVDVTAFHLGNLPDVQIRRLVAATSASALPALTHLFATDGAHALQSLYYRGGRYYLWATLFLPPPLIVFAEPLVQLYVGATYLDSAYVLITILGVYPFTWASAMFYQVAYATGRIRAFNLCNLVLVIATLALLVLFVVELKMGAIGAGYAFGIAFTAVHLFVMWPWGLKLVSGRWSEFLSLTVLKGSLPFIAALISCGIYRLILPIESWGIFTAGCALSATVYFGVLFGVCRDKTDKELTAKLIQRTAKRLKAN